MDLRGSIGIGTTVFNFSDPIIPNESEFIIDKTADGSFDNIDGHQWSERDAKLGSDQLNATSGPPEKPCQTPRIHNTQTYQHVFQDVLPEPVIALENMASITDVERPNGEILLSSCSYYIIILLKTRATFSPSDSAGS